MKQKNKELLLQDLCTRIPYGVKVKVKHYDDVWKLLAIYTNGTTYTTRDVGYPIEIYFEDCKPYLFPISSMTEEQRKELQELHFDYIFDEIFNDIEFVYHYDCIHLINWLNKNHFDYRGLIEKGLAIDATNKNIY